MSYLTTTCPICRRPYLRPSFRDPGCPTCPREAPRVEPGQLSMFGDGCTRAVNLRVEAFDVYAGRATRGADGSQSNDPRDIAIGTDGWLGNPWDVRKHSNALELFREYFTERVARDWRFRAAVLALKGKRLGCFCKPARCHADIIADWVEANAGGER